MQKRAEAEHQWKENRENRHAETHLVKTAIAKTKLEGDKIDVALKTAAAAAKIDGFLAPPLEKIAA